MPQTPLTADYVLNNYSSMSKTEIIELCDMLGTKYYSLAKMQSEIDSISNSLRNDALYQPKRYSAFRFFWPFLIYGAVSFSICYILALLSYSSFPLMCFLLIGCFVLPIVFVIVGGVRARILRAQCTRDAENNAYRRRVKMDEDRERLDDLISSEKKLRAELALYDSIVPENMRNKSRMGYARKMLETDKAKTFEEAMHLIH